jgi:ribosomal-protein-alanine N-acetyltransferase
MTVVMQTERLALRPFIESDLDDLCRLYADPEIRRYFPDGTLSRRETEDELRWCMDGGDPSSPGIVLHAAVDRRTGEFVGRGGFVSWVIDGAPQVEIAYLLDKRLWRQGLGSEMAAGLVRHGFSSLRLPRLIALIDPSNIASVRTALKVGMSFERQTSMEGHICSLYSVAKGG